MKLINFIEGLGFNLYEKEIITYLASTESASARQIYKNTKVPLGRVYSVIHSLVDKKIVDVLIGKPKSYAIPDVKKSLKKFLDSKKSFIEEQALAVEKVQLNPKKPSDKKDPSVRIFVGRDEHLDALVSMKENAKNEILQIAPLFIGNYAVNKNLEEALRRGVKMRIIVRKITPQNKKNISVCKKHGAQVRVLNSQDLLSMAVQDSEGLLMGVQDYHNQEERMTLFTKNKAIIQAMKNMFEAEWKSAKPI